MSHSHHQSREEQINKRANDAERSHKENAAYSRGKLTHKLPADDIVMKLLTSRGSEEK